MQLRNRIKSQDVQCGQQVTTVIAALVLRVFRTEDPAQLHHNGMQVIGSQLMFQVKVHHNVLKGYSFAAKCAVPLQQTQQGRIPPEIAKLPGEQPQTYAFEVWQWQ